MFNRVIAAAFLALCGLSVHSQMVAIGSSGKVIARDGVLSGWSEWEVTIPSECFEDLTPGEFDGYQNEPQTRYKTILQYPTGSGTWPSEPGFTLPDDIEDGKIWDEQTVEVGCDYVEPEDPEGPYTPPPSGSGFTTLRITAETGSPPYLAAEGAFRNTCAYSHMAKDDPIVYPGVPGASHMHIFFGNTSTDEDSDTASLDAANSSTCAGGIANESAYWIPAMLNADGSEYMLPSEFLFYYKTGYGPNPENIQVPPDGLRMLGGELANNASAPEEYYLSRHYYECNNEARSYDTVVLEVTANTPGGACPPGSTFHVRVSFPNCWDGVNFDSPNHRSHMAFYNGWECPSSHPVRLPNVQLNFGYVVAEGEDTRLWRLSSDTYSTAIAGGRSMHADWWVKWDEDVVNAWVQNCVRELRDCHAFLLGDGTMLY